MDHTLKSCKFNKAGKCELGFHGGNPYEGNCIACMNAGENNEQFALEFKLRLERSHPSTANKVSGCCDSAKNYT